MPSSACCIPLGRIEISKQMSSEAKDEEEFALEIAEPKHQQWRGLNESTKLEFLRLVRIRDFLSLILTYPMTLPDHHLSRKWRDDAQVLITKCFEHTDFVQVNVPRAYSWTRLLSEKPLKNMEVLIPNDILSKIEDGQRSIFSENAAILTGDAVASVSTSKGKEVLELANVHNIIPEAIFNLAVDLAVGQLIQTLLTGNIHHVVFSTRNRVEKIDVMRKIEVALNDEHNRTSISKKFSKVLWVDASKYSSNTEVCIQQEIARQLDLMTLEGDQIENNDILLTRLIEVEMMRKNHLVFLVDVDDNGRIDPRKVGLPKKTLASVVVLLTIESSVQEHDELTTAMDLEIRTEDHIMPWELFCRNVGRVLVPSSGDIQKIAVKIVEECRGHLLAIVLVARSLKDMEDIQLWKCALTKLGYLHPLCANRIHDNMNKVMVNAFTNIVWNNLNEIEKLCLACSLYVLRLDEKLEDHLLISSWVYNKLVYSLEEAEHILRDFVRRCILLQLEGKYIRWPEEIYDVLKSLLNLDPFDTIKKGGLGLTELLTTGEWLLARNIELMDNKLSELPPTLACPKLTRLLLQGNANLLEIPPFFFHEVSHLSILDLSYTSIRSLPRSFFNLEELRELYLKECKFFMELPTEIGQLKNLEILDLDSTPIKDLPEQTQELTKLEKLILSFYACHDTMKSLQYQVPPGVISKLTHLLYLSIDMNPINKHWDENIQVILRDISELQELNTLILYIPQAELLKHVPQCLDFRFVVGNHVHQRIISRAPPTVEAKFKQHSCSLRFVNGVNILNDNFNVIRRSEAIFLERHKTILNLSQIDVGSLAHLQLFIVGECNAMLALIDEGCSYRPNLCWRFLYVFYMFNLRSICEVEAYFYSLKTIALHSCPNLTIIFTLNFLDSLVNLEELVVEDCPKLRTLISLESFESKEGIFLPRLRNVSLLFLPELVSISCGLCIGPNLERIGFYYCPKLQILSTKEVGSEHLKVIIGEKEWWEALKWEETDWGKDGRPDYLHDKFSPINEEADIFDQLFEGRDSSRSNIKEVWVENLVEEADIFFTLNDDAGIMDLLRDDDEYSSSSNMETSVYLESKDTLARDKDESSRSNKKKISEAEVTDVGDDNESTRSNTREASVGSLPKGPHVSFALEDEAEIMGLQARDEDESSTSNEETSGPEIMDVLERDDNDSSRSNIKEASEATTLLEHKEAEIVNLLAKDDDEPARSNKTETSVYPISKDALVSDENESSRSKKDEISGAEILDLFVGDDVESSKSNTKETSFFPSDNTARPTQPAHSGKGAEIMDLLARDDNDPSRSNIKKASFFPSDNIARPTQPARRGKVYLRSKDILVSDEVESSRSNKKAISFFPRDNFARPIQLARRGKGAEIMNVPARDDNASSRSNVKDTSVYLKSKNTLVREKDESSRSNKKEISVFPSDKFVRPTQPARRGKLSSGDSARHSCKKGVLELDLHDDRRKRKAMEAVSGLAVH